MSTPPENSYSVWLRRARSNLALARAAGAGILFEDLCFEAQQAVEKSLKALLIGRNQPFPYTHNIGTLVTLLVNLGIIVPQVVRDSSKLTEYAITTRYPGSDPVDAEQYDWVLRVAEQVVEWVETYAKAAGFEGA